jgi:peptidyl-prolyl cis-trans isomerase D
LLKANTFLSTVKDVKSFDAAVEKGKYTKLVVEEIRESDYMVGALGVNRSLVKEIFKTSVGKVLSEPVEMGNQFVVVVVTAEEKAGLPSAKKLRPRVEFIVRNELKGKILVEKVKGATTLEAAAEKWGVQVQRADSISFVSPTLPVAGYELLAGGYGFYKAGLNKVSKPFVGNTGAFLVRPEQIGAKADAAANVAEMTKTLLSQQKSMLLYSSMEALRKAATVVDRRSKFL